MEAPDTFHIPHISGLEAKVGEGWLISLNFDQPAAGTYVSAQ
ncbi:hypothetical protein ACWDAO_20230 [Streptomyces sp. NPDC001212]